MAFLFTDGFDCYAAMADLALGYWEAGTNNGTIVTGRFTGSRGIRGNSTSAINSEFTKTSSQNDAVHHFHVAFLQNNALGAATVNRWITLFDGSTAQCTIAFRGDGSIILASGASTGTVLATYSSAFTATVWNSFEIEVVINNTTGSFKVRKNGNTSDDSATTGLNTRGGTANNYANKIGIGCSATGFSMDIDDFVWQSSAAAGTWIGEVRCRTRRPAADSGSPQWTRSASGSALTLLSTPNTNTGITAGVAKLSVPLTVSRSGVQCWHTCLQHRHAVRCDCWADHMGRSVL